MPIDRQDYASESEELADMIADNRIAELAEADRAMLRDLAEQLDDGAFDMDLTGFDQNALEELMTAAPPESEIDAEPQIDKAEELRKKWGVKRGQIWELGDHRLMCGDSTKESVLNGDRPDCIVADPPYGINLDTDYSGMIGWHKGKKHQRIAGDDKRFNAANVVGTTSAEQFWFGADYYARTLGDTESEGAWLVWDKRLDDSADKMFGSCFELVWSKQKHKRDILRHKWAGFFTDGEPRTYLHATEKPTAVIVDLINMTKATIIYDPFVGSGTTIIACEQLGRKCRAMEIDPGYVAVSIQRWVDATGKTPKLLNGKAK